MKKLQMLFAALFVVLMGAGMAQARELTVSAAASLTNAFQELAAVFEKEHPGMKIHTNFAASNPLLKQIVEGAPVDVFASADQGTMYEAEKAKVVDSSTRRDFAKNDLVLIVPKNAKKQAALEDLAEMERIAIGNPDSVPAGRYARDSLKNAGLWDKLQSKFVQGASVRQVLDYVARGEADAGAVYGTDALQQKDKVDIALVMGGHEPVAYPIAVALPGGNKKDAREFVDFVLSPGGQKILAKYGFKAPDAQ